MVPAVKSILISAGPIAQSLIEDSVKCQNLDKDVQIIENGLCVSVSYALDSFWFGCIVLGLTGMLSLPIYIGVANGIASKTAKQHDNSKEYDKEQEEEKVGSSKEVKATKNKNIIKTSSDF